MHDINAIREYMYEMVSAWGTTSATPHENATFDEFGLDSLDRVEMVMEIENHFDIDLTDEQVEKFVTLNDAANAIYDKLNEKAV